MDNNIVKSNIITRRKELGLTQTEMAEKLGISRNAYRRIEKGETRLVNDNIEKIASLLEQTSEELVLGYTPYPDNGKTLEDIRVEISNQADKHEVQYKSQINSLKQSLIVLEDRVKLLEDLVKTKDEIIQMLKKMTDH